MTMTSVEEPLTRCSLSRFNEPGRAEYGSLHAALSTIIDNRVRYRGWYMTGSRLKCGTVTRTYEHSRRPSSGRQGTIRGAALCLSEDRSPARRAGLSVGTGCYESSSSCHRVQGHPGHMHAC